MNNGSKACRGPKAQADLIRKERDLDDARRELDLTIEKRVRADLGAEREKAKKEAEEELKLKVMEKDQTITSMQKQIEELKRRAEQGSQQLQGEVQELELEALLLNRFPRDIIQPVPKGEFGGDVLHRVVGTLGQQCGTILWESKRTKNWSDGWLAKLREDQRTAKAEIAVIIMSAAEELRLFSSMKAFGSRIKVALPLACPSPDADQKSLRRGSLLKANKPKWRWSTNILLDHASAKESSYCRVFPPCAKISTEKSHYAAMGRARADRPRHAGHGRHVRCLQGRHKTPRNRRTGVSGCWISAAKKVNRTRY